METDSISQPASPVAIRGQWYLGAIALGMISSAILMPTLSSLHGSGPPDHPVAAGTNTEHTLEMEWSDTTAAITRLHAAIDRGDVEYAEAMLRMRLDQHPNDDGLRTELIELARNRAPQRDSTPYETARSLLPRRFNEHETSRFVVLSDADSNWTRLQAERLERAHHQFMRFAQQLDLKPLPLRHKLVCILFELQDDYAEFAATHDEINARWIGGYYAPKHDWIVFYNVESNPSVGQARRQIAEMEREIRSLRQQADEARRAGNRRILNEMTDHVQRYEQHVREQRNRVESFAADTLMATTMHEAVHQLSFHTLIQHPRVHYPLWISEGLATAFETTSPRQAFGPGREHADRRHAFRSLLERGELLPLQELVSISDREAMPSDSIGPLYHQSYALVSWLYRHRRADLAEYLRMMRSSPHRRFSEEEYIEQFEHAFGHLNQLERAWLRDEHSEHRR